MKKFSWLWISAAALMISGCKSDAPVSNGVPETVEARVVAANAVALPVMEHSTGTLRAHESATLSAQIMGRVRQVLVREGDRVRAGQTLVMLDDAGERASTEQADAGVKAAEEQLAAAQANADLAQSTLSRYKLLEAQKSVSPQEMDEISRRAEAARAQVEALKSQVAVARAQQAGARNSLGYTRIAAPFAGVVTARLADPGTMAAPGVPLVQVDSAEVLELQTTVPESLIASLHKGMKIGFTADSLNGQRLDGSVSEIVPSADPATHSFLVKIAAPPSAQLMPGMYATAEIPHGMKQAVLAPRSAIQIRGSLACAYVLDSNGLAQLHYLTLGSVHGDKVEVLSGLNGGEKLVDNPSDRDLAGKRIAQ
jgi:RND family efflux transporter MFP subunit